MGKKGLKGTGHFLGIVPLFGLPHLVNPVKRGEAGRMLLIPAQTPEPDHLS
jgi:hypothetical protein